MKEVLAHIETKKQEFAKCELFKFLQDKSIPPKQRLAFAPCLAPFVMGFGELNEYVWRDEPTNDMIQAIINQQTYEDDNHWVWYLEDLEKLCIDMSLNYTDALRFIYSKEIQSLRQTFYEMYRCSYKAIPVHKLAIIEVAEATADVFFEATIPVVEELKLTSDVEYKYFGMHHLLIDSNHSMDSSETIESISKIQMEKEVEEKAFELVNHTFESFSKSVDALMHYAKRYELQA